MSREAPATSRREVPGPVPLGGGRCHFRVWAPRCRRVEVVPEDGDSGRALRSEARGVHRAVLAGWHPGRRYRLRLDGGRCLPDPASRHQPEGVDGPSAVPDPSFPWSDGDWRGRAREELVIYELHVGAFSPEGTFRGVRDQLSRLSGLGVTAVELMPVGQFPGNRNWGYDGVFPWAPHAGYGGPGELRRLVDACHANGLAVILDVVYNHVGPEGSVLEEYGPYFSRRHRTPWGPGMNFDGAGSDEVRRFFVENAWHWISEYHVDGLRLDAVHAILDGSAVPFLEELVRTVGRRAERLQRPVHLIAESAENDPRLVEAARPDGPRFDAMWNDDLHHGLHVLLTGESEGYYADYGGLGPVTKSLREGLAYTGQYSSYRRRRHGRKPEDARPVDFVAYLQNHDQVGNRPRGDRLDAAVGLEAHKLGAGLVLLSPFLPLLFMGEEYGERAPFPYFVSHADPELREEVRRGRASELEAFGWSQQPADPADPATYQAAKMVPGLRREEPHATLEAWYRTLLRLRRDVPALGAGSEWPVEATAEPARSEVRLRRRSGDSEILALFHFDGVAGRASVPVPAGRWQVLLDSSAPRWGGPGRELADRLESGGSVELPLLPHALLLLLQREPEG